MPSFSPPADSRATIPAIPAVLLVLLLHALALHKAYASELSPFTSDGCSAFPDGTLAQNELWLKCCTAHDLAYWKGGTYQQRMDADKALEHCVTQVGEPNVALLMLAGVRVGGSPWLPTPFRWGYGWPYPRPYGELTPAEQQQISAEHPRLDDKNTALQQKNPYIVPPSTSDTASQ